MKKIFIFASLLTLINIIQSCSENNELLGKSNYVAISSDSILQERSPLLPNVTTHKIKSNTRALGINGAIIGNSDILLGHSYDVGNSIIGDYSNVKFPVIDIDKVKNLDNSIVTSLLLNQMNSSITTYNGMSNYEANSSVTKKVASGFNLNLSLFKIGRKKTTTEVFKEATSSSSNVVYGELNVELRNSSFSMLSTNGYRNLYARECLSNSFLYNLYKSTIANIIESYGQYVLTSYITGGKAFGLYAGIRNDNASAQQKEKDMNDDISASFSWKNNSASSSLNFGKNNSSSTSYKYMSQDTQVQIRTFGGSSNNQVAVSTTKLDNLSVDLSPWLNSLSDFNKHTIIDIGDGGLFPLSAFVLEENFKNRFDDTTNGYLEKKAKLEDPKIEIVRVYVRSTSSGEQLYEVAAVLTTRQGDKIVLSDESLESVNDAILKANNDKSIYDNTVTKIFNKKRIFFEGVKFTKNYSTKYDPAIRAPYVCIRLNGFDENAMYKYTNTKTGMVYIYNPSNKIALSYYVNSDDGDAVLDDYGMRNWIESINTRAISMATLTRYKIIGL